MRKCVSFTGICLFGVVALMAQEVGADKGFPIRGEISSAGAIQGSLTVELGGNGSGPSEIVTPQGDGSFEFSSVTRGVHDLRVIGPGGVVVYQENVVINGPNDRLAVRLPEGNSASRAAGTMVSVRQLEHKIPPQAQKAFAKGERAAAKHDYKEAAQCFRQAVTIDPEYADAYNELGAAEVELKELPQAAEEFQKAIDLEPEHRLALPNLCIVLAKMKHFHEAGEVARRALKVDPGAGRIRYILAASLLFEHGNIDEALDNLQRAAAEVPRARLLAADLLVERGRNEDAVKELQEYLHTAPLDDADRAKAEARLTELRQ